MALPPQYAAEEWGCAICGAYPHTSQVFFKQTAEEIAAREAAAEADRRRRNTPGWTGPQRTTLPGGVWLCEDHASQAEDLSHLRRKEALKQLRGQGPAEDARQRPG